MFQRGSIERKKNFLYIVVRNNQIATSVKLLDIMHKPYGFNADLLETIN